jgi:excisionase family DNA binding protein
MSETLLTIPEAGKRLGVKRTTVYQLIRRRDLELLKIGDRSVITNSSIDALIERLRAEAQAKNAA